MKNISKKKILVIAGIVVLCIVAIFAMRKLSAKETKVMTLSEQIDNNEVTIGLYKNKLIKWKVLDKDLRNYRALLFCDDSIDYNISSDNPEDRKWSSSNLRDYLNGDFCYSAFVDTERNSIIETPIENKANPILGTDAGPNTVDKIFVLGFDDAKKYLNINSLNEYNGKYGNGIHPAMWVKYAKKDDSIFVKSGYYLDKASFSDDELAEMLSKVEKVEKPENLGEVVLPDLSTIALTRNKMFDITDSDIETEIQKEAGNDSVYSKVNREAQFNDKVNIDFKGYIDGVAFDGGESTDCELVLGSGQFIPGFEEKIVGHKIGQEFTIDVTFPVDYATELSGKLAKFDIIINSIEEPDMSEIDTEFIKKHTKNNSKTIEEYKSELRERLKTRQDTINNQDFIMQLQDKLLSESKFNPTKEALAWQFSIIIDQLNKQAKDNDTSIKNILASDGGSVANWYKQIKESTTEGVKIPMIVDEFSKKYNVQINDADVKEWFNIMSDAFGYGSEVTYEDYVQYAGYENLLEAVKQEKLFLEAIKHCKVVDEN